MRFFEIVLLALLLLPLVWPLTGWKRPFWLDGLSLTAVIVIIPHLIWESTRWQMVPAYLLAVLLAAGVIWRRVRPQPQTNPRSGIRAARGLLGLLLFLLAAALPIALPVPNLPAATGPYTIGATSLKLTDNGRPEIFTDDPDDVRELMMQVWYPAQPTDNAEPAPYLEALDVAGPVLAEQFDLPAFLFNHINLTETGAYLDAPLPDEPTTYPVILFSHGLTGIRMQNTAMVQELVSHGYVVAAVDHTYANALTVFPDGRVIFYDPNRIFTNGRSNPEEGNRLVQQWAADLTFLLDTLTAWDSDPGHRFYGRLDLDRAGVFGHSTGGGATLEFCLRDRRCQAGVGLDSWVLPVSADVLDSSPPQPFMFINTPDWLGPDNTRRGETILANLTNDAYRLTLAQTSHFDFTDLPLFSPLTHQLGLSGAIDSHTSITIQNEYLLAFFDRYLKNGPVELLARPSPYPELMIQIHR